MAKEFKVHHATTEAVLVQLQDGGFGRLTAASLGGDVLADRLLKHFAARPTVIATPRRLRDAQGYLMLGCALEEVWSGVLAYPERVRELLRQLYRRHHIVSVGDVQHARVVRSTAKGTIYSLANGITAVAPLETAASGVQSNDVRVLSYDTATGGVTVTAEEAVVSHAPMDAAEFLKAVEGFAVGQQLRGRVVLAQDADGGNAVVDVVGAGGVHLIAYMLPPATARAAAVPPPPAWRRHQEIVATIEFCPTALDLAQVAPFIVLSDRAPFGDVPPIRRVAPAASTSGPFPWRDKAHLQRNAGREGDAHDGDDRPLRRRRLEEAIDAFERTREEDVVPKSPEEFQKLLLATPNSSYLWTQFIAFHVGLHQYEEGRLVAERALKTIGVRESKELINVWVAYMNLENAHGTAESLTSVFRRAVQHTGSDLVLHEKLADIFKASKKHQQLQAITRVMTSKFRNVPRVWERYGMNLIDSDKRDQLKRVIRDMGEALKKCEQCLVVEHLAIYEYRQGNVASGRALFEGLVSKLPKQSDLWSAFLDQEIAQITRKTADASTTFTRDLFERVTSVSFSAKVMQQLLTRFLSFEQTHGTPQGVEKVKAKARGYVEGRLAATQGGGDPMHGA